MRTSQRSEVFFFLSNVNSVHVSLVATSYLLLLHYRVAKKMTEDYGKCVEDNHICRMGILYVAKSLEYLLLYVILFMLNNIYMTQKDMLRISILMYFCSWNVQKAIFKKQHGPSAFISMVSQFL